MLYPMQRWAFYFIYSLCVCLCVHGEVVNGICACVCGICASVCGVFVYGICTHVCVYGTFVHLCVYGV